MHILKLDATDSTNQYLKDLMLSKPLADFTVVSTREQLKGRGQMGAKWETEPGKNLTVSVLKKFDDFFIEHQFLLNMCVSLAVLDALRELSVPNIHVKWPNDILSGNTKICGILIENVLLGQQIQASIIGIGLNINQLDFNNISNVSSLKLLLGRTFNLDEVLYQLLAKLKDAFLNIKIERQSILHNRYEKELFRKDKPSTFKDQKGKFFMGFIRSVSSKGKLVVELEDAVVKEFDLKEIKLLY